MYQLSLAITKQHLESDRPTITATLHDLARLYEDQEEHVKAEQVCHQALSICEDHLGLLSVTTAISKRTLARIYFARKKYLEAKPLSERALRTFKHRLGDHLFTATCFLDLALLYQRQEKYEAAEPMMEAALVTCRRVLDPKHPQTKKTREHYIALLRVMEQQNEAALLKISSAEQEKNKDG